MNKSNLNSNQFNFYSIMSKCRTDKVDYHGYHFFYPRYLNDYRKLKDYGMIEIGVFKKQSLRAWLDYFPYFYIYGLDINLQEQSERFRIIKCDQSKKEDLDNAISLLNHKILFIIDDGSHHPVHQLDTFNVMFKILQPGGTYIIEDIETSYWKDKPLYGYNVKSGYRHEKSIIEIFKNLADDVNKEYLNDEILIKHDENASLIDKENRKYVSSITFGQNCIIIVKKTDAEKAYFDRRYRFYDNLL